MGLKSSQPLAMKTNLVTLGWARCLTGLAYLTGLALWGRNDEKFSCKLYEILFQHPVDSLRCFLQSTIKYGSITSFHREENKAMKVVNERANI